MTLYVIPIIGLLLADATIGDAFTPFVNLGVAGVMLTWFMRRVEPKLERIGDIQNRESMLTQEALDRVARSNLLLVISSGLKPLQDQAETLTAELEKSAQARAESARAINERKP
jgi:hypothetical protein